jgi:hypothetical protein
VPQEVLPPHATARANFTGKEEGFFAECAETVEEK